MGFVDIGFPVTGRLLPADHGYLLFCALCRHLPRLRQEPEWGVHPVLGRPAGSATLELFQHSLVQLRIPAGDVDDVMALAGRSLCIGRHVLRLGRPGVYSLQPATRLRSRCVTVHGHDDPTRFEPALRRELSALPESVNVEQIAIAIGERRYARTRSRVVPGFEVTLHDVDPLTSLAVQGFGVGGRRYLGLGLFVPSRPIERVDDQDRPLDATA